MRVMKDWVFNWLCSLLGEPVYRVYYDGKLTEDGDQFPPLYFGGKEKALEMAKRDNAIVTVTFNKTCALFDFRKKKEV